ncbi:uncharacterized protein PSFLO_00530 [Pseudozyma flocculosa]|uniref:Uncharacterized protein n=1 Tax=Pseudozyma flocculosa TaxID=84751 RepID=A0A5C3EVA2_9BASI|nr:uncharacterized protein PSFLO_00530 [Pseudozyma flocculosa]
MSNGGTPGATEATSGRARLGWCRSWSGGHAEQAWLGMHNAASTADPSSLACHLGSGEKGRRVLGSIDDSALYMYFGQGRAPRGWSAVCAGTPVRLVSAAAIGTGPKWKTAAAAAAVKGRRDVDPQLPLRPRTWRPSAASYPLSAEPKLRSSMCLAPSAPPARAVPPVPANSNPQPFFP